MNLDGSYSNEFEAAFDLSRREYDPADELDKIMALTDEGKYVVVYVMEICCKFTDALINTESRVGSVHDTLEEAREACPEEDGSLYIVGPAEVDDFRAIMGKEPEGVDVPDEDIPF